LSGLESGASWQYSIDNGAHWTNGIGSSNTFVGDGVYNVLVHETDVAGNVSANTALTFTLDTTAPVLTVETIGPGSSGKLNLNGTTAAATSVSVSDNGSSLGSTTADGAGNWTFNVGKPTNVVHDFKVTDVAGNETHLFYGSSGADNITGSGFNDRIIGGGGGDTMNGGAGNDTFVYNAINESRPGAGNFDTINGFVHGSDKIDFSALGNLAISSGTTGPGSIAAHSAYILTSGGNTTIYVNNSNGNEATSVVDMEIHLTGVTNITASDLLHH